MKKGWRLHYGLAILVVSIFVEMGVIGFARFGYTILLPSMKDGLRLSYAETGLLASGNFAGYLVFSIIAGFVVTRVSPRLVIAGSIALAGVTMVLTGAAPGYLAALIARTLTGVGSAGSNVPMMGLASAWFAKKWRGTATGLIVGGSGCALLVSGWLVPALTTDRGPDGWRIGWYVLGGLVVLIAIAALAVLRNRPEEKGLRPIGSKGIQSAVGALETTRGVWHLVFKSKPLWQLGGVYFLFGFSYIIYTTFFSAFLVKEASLSEQEAGQAFAVVGMLSIVSGFIWGTVSDRVGRRYGLSIVFVLQAAAIGLFVLASDSLGFFASAALFGLAAWSVPAIAAAACGDYVGAKLAPAALGFVTIMFGIGQAIGPYFAGLMKDATSSFEAAFLTASGASLIAAVASLTLAQPASVPRVEPALSTDLDH